MILGRAQKLEWELIRSFPMTEAGEPDWSVFENGPPDYICEMFTVLEDRARATRPRLLNAQRELGMPAWADIKPCLANPDAPGRYLYEPADWGFRRRRSGAPARGAQEQSPALARKRRRAGQQKLTSEFPVQQEAMPPSSEGQSGRTSPQLSPVRNPSKRLRRKTRNMSTAATSSTPTTRTTCELPLHCARSK